MALKNSEVDRLNGKMESMKSYSETLEKETSDLRSQVAKLNNEINEGANSTIKQEHKKNQQEIEIFDLKKQLSVARDDNKRLVAEIAVANSSAQEHA